MDSQIIVYSPYNDKIDSRIKAAQQKVFKFLDINLVQIDIGEATHATWLDEFVRNITSDPIVICDIDAFPIRRSAFDQAIQQARSGALVGMAQVANHKAPTEIYAGPMFLAFTSQLYKDLGKPRLTTDRNSDTAQQLTRVATENNINVCLTYPKFALKPKWPLANAGIFGIGTFYGDNEFFHLFESNTSRHINIFEKVAQDVCDGQLQFGNYLNMIGVQNKKRNPPQKILKSLRKIMAH